LSTLRVVAPPALVAALAAEVAPSVASSLKMATPSFHRHDHTRTLRFGSFLASAVVDAVLVVNVTGDSGVQERYAGTIFQR